MRALPILFAAFILWTTACTSERKVDVSNINPSKMPTMRTENVSTLISDSGITQYKIVSPIWLVYDEAHRPYWHFPKGLYLQKYDRNFNVIASVACDSAYYWKNEKLWQLDGHVEMHQVPKTLFLTQQLFWNERTHQVYTDSFIHVENLTHVLEGHGFHSDEKLTSYSILHPTGIFPVNSSTSAPSTGALGAPSTGIGL